jgi:hypothetical protein
MSRLKNHPGVPSLFGPERQADGLKKTSRWGDQAWKPGEIPVNGPGSVGSLRTVWGPLDQPRQPYGEFLGVQKPVKNGTGYSPIEIVEIEGRETSTKQKGK